MKAKRIVHATLSACLLLLMISSCKKSGSEPVNNGLALLEGTWQTTVWGGANDTARAAISSSATTGALTYLGASAQAASKFSTGDVIYSNITSNGNGTFNCTGTFRYTAAGSSNINGTVGTTQAVLTLQNSNTVLYAHYSANAASGITPPDYYWYKK